MMQVDYQWKQAFLSSNALCVVIARWTVRVMLLGSYRKFYLRPCRSQCLRFGSGRGERAWSLSQEAGFRTDKCVKIME